MDHRALYDRHHWDLGKTPQPEGQAKPLSHPAIDQALERGEVDGSFKPSELADMLIAVVRGGFVLSLATGDDTHFERATSAASQLIRSRVALPSR